MRKSGVCSLARMGEKATKLPPMGTGKQSVSETEADILFLCMHTVHTQKRKYPKKLCERLKSSLPMDPCELNEKNVAQVTTTRLDR